jgi:uncharacterized protein (TIGR02246 family)
MKSYAIAAGMAVLMYAVSAGADRMSNVGGAATDLENEKVIRKLYADFTTAWNKHEVQALAKMWSLDGDLLEPDGTVAKGRGAIADHLQQQHDTVFKHTTLSFTISDVWFISDSVALVDGGYGISGIRTREGTELPKRSGHLTAVLIKEDGQWWIAASRLMVPTTLPYKK